MRHKTSKDFFLLVAVHLLHKVSVEKEEECVRCSGVTESVLCFFLLLLFLLKLPPSAQFFFLIFLHKPSSPPSFPLFLVYIFFLLLPIHFFLVYCLVVNVCCDLLYLSRVSHKYFANILASIFFDNNELSPCTCPF